MESLRPRRASCILIVLLVLLGLLLVTCGKGNYELTVSTVGEGTVSISPDQATYAKGSSVILTATPADGWEFQYWYGFYPEAYDNPITAIIDSDRDITAHFVPISDRIPSATTTTEGMMQVDPNYTGPSIIPPTTEGMMQVNPTYTGPSIIPPGP